jgi:hypothetical protein
VPWRAGVEALEGRALLSLAPPAVGGDPSVNPADFRVTVFASGLNFPVGVLPMSDGSTYVVLNNPNPGSTSYFDSTGQIVRLTDTDGNGVADGPGTIVAAGLPGTLTFAQKAGPFIVVTDSSGELIFLRMGATPADPLTQVATVNFSFPPPSWEHTTFGLATRPTPGQPGSYDVIFNIGAQYNGIEIVNGAIVYQSNGVAVPVPDTGQVTASGLFSATLF